MEKPIIYSKQTIEFITVAAEFCAFLEETKNYNRSEFVDKIVKILPLLYLKALLLPDTSEQDIDDDIELIVTEEDYQYIRLNIQNILSDKDDYLEVFLSDIQYSDAPITSFISEDLADIYQDIKNFLSVFSHQYEPTMLNSLIVLNSNFKDDWSQKLVNVLRPLNTILFSDDSDDEFIEDNENRNQSSNWLFDNQKDSELDVGQF